MNVFNRINYFREQRGWSMWKLSEECGISQPTVSAWFSKNRMPTVESLEKVCEAFGITMSQFFADENNFIDINKQQKEMLENWSALNKKQQENVLALVKSMTGNN